MRHVPPKRFNAIVKVQKSVITNDPTMPWLVYDRSRQFMTHIPDKEMPPNVKNEMKGDLKGYFTAKIKSGRLLLFGQRVAGENW